jgi:hypothetical protein
VEDHGIASGYVIFDKWRNAFGLSEAIAPKNSYKAFSSQAMREY